MLYQFIAMILAAPFSAVLLYRACTGPILDKPLRPSKRAAMVEDERAYAAYFTLLKGRTA